MKHSTYFPHRASRLPHLPMKVCTDIIKLLSPRARFKRIERGGLRGIQLLADVLAGSNEMAVLAQTFERGYDPHWCLLKAAGIVDEPGEDAPYMYVLRAAIVAHFKKRNLWNTIMIERAKKRAGIEDSAGSTT